MSTFDDIDNLTSKEAKEKAQKAGENQREEQANILQAYARLFKTRDGQRVLTDLSQRYLYNNGIDMDSKNIDYRAAFANGEAEVVKQIINNMQKAKVV